MKPRSRAKQTRSLHDRLAEFAAAARAEAASLPEGRERDRLLKTIRRAEAASEFEAWASAPEPAPKQPL
ncbi:hypothetical protein NB311A_20206 [Nitrobacter sp. Nb-311A]|nr:hypothetical protein NB311A_20206 [Nitrobacter sp. Nb-311A]